MNTNHDRRHCSANLKLNTNTSRYYRRSQAHKKIKQIVRPKRFDGIDLVVELERVVLLNPPSLCTLPRSERRYQVVWRIDPGGREHATSKAEGEPNPEWNKKYIIGLNRNPVNEGLFVNVEVLRYNSVENRRDPGTSDGIGKVFRGRIPFPKSLNKGVRGRYELVTSDGAGDKIAGDIILSMKLETYIIQKRKK